MLVNFLVGASFALLWWKGLQEGARLDPHSPGGGVASLLRRPGAFRALGFTLAVSTATTYLAALLSS